MKKSLAYIVLGAAICIGSVLLIVSRQSSAQQMTSASATQPFQTGQSVGLLINYGGKMVDTHCKIEEIKGTWLKCSAILPNPPDEKTGMGSIPYKADWVNTNSVIAVFPAR